MMRFSSGRFKAIGIVVIAVLAISLDLVSSKKYKAEMGTFRYESDFDAVTAATTTVSIVPSDYEELSDPISKTTNPSYAQIEDMVRKAIELQGGLDWVISPGDKVMLKVNLVGKNSPSGQGENTDVRVVKAIIKIIDEHTAGDVEIIVAEGSARVNDVVDEVESVWDNSGYQDLLTDSYLSGINFSLFNLNQSYEDLIEVNLGRKATAAPHGGFYHVHRKELEADVYIVVPVMKIHDTGLTSALKNQIGTAPAAYYGYNKMNGTQYYGGLAHDVDHRRWTTEEIVDLCAIADIDFVVVDAIMCLEKYKSYQGDNQVRFNTILAGADPVAVDHVGARMFGLNPDDVAHITLAEKIGLGTNNPEFIEIVGSSIETVKKKVIKNDSENGKFGQSNRTWLLSGAFVSTDIDEQLISDEALLEPIAGQEGWSEPVYFFDDRIDLLSYYQEEENVISYAFTYFSSPAEQDAELWVGTGEDMKVYINGNSVYSYSGVNVFGDNDLYTEIVPVSIREGVNTLLVKTLNKFGDYSFCLNICEVEDNPIWEGNRVEGLKFFTSLADTGTGGGELSSPEFTNDTARDFSIWPNPSEGPLNLSLELAQSSATRIFITDISGREVCVLLNDRLSAGIHNLTWNLCGTEGLYLNQGIYFISLEAGTVQISKRLLINP